MSNKYMSALERVGEKGFESTNNRIESLDFFRGIAMMFMILFHSAIYTFPNNSLIVVEQPSLIVVLMSSVATWGGIFIILSMVINTIMLMRRNQHEIQINHFLYLLIAGIVYLSLHFGMIIFFGRWNNNFLTNQPNLTLIASAIRYRQLALPRSVKLFDGSAMSTIGLNLIVITLALLLMFKRFNLNHLQRYSLEFGLMGLLILIFSLIRVTFFSVFQQAVESLNFLAGIPLGFFFNHPYPLLPYLAYGFFGSMVGMLIFSENKRLFNKMVIPFGVLFTFTGLVGMWSFTWTIAKPDFYWYFKTVFELGVFLLIVVLLTVVEGKIKFIHKIIIVKWFSWISLSIFLLETTTSEIFILGWSLIFPGWNETILGCIAFGCFNVFAWIGILSAWRKVDFKYSIEYCWVRIFNRIGKNSTKMDFLAN